MTLYNNATHLPEAIESLLAQTDRDFSLILVDDASSDATESVARSYAARDPRITYHRHESRQAMIATWRDVVEIAVREHPSAEYFAWVSDHDRWHPRWLERLRAELDGDPTRCSRIRLPAESDRPAPSWTKVRDCSTRPAARTCGLAGGTCATPRSARVTWCTA